METLSLEKEIGKIIRYKVSKRDVKTMTLVDVIGKGKFGGVFKAQLDGYGLIAVKLRKFHNSIYNECDISTTKLEHSATMKRLIYNPADKGILSNDAVKINSKNKDYNISVESDDVAPGYVYQLYDLVDGFEFTEVYKSKQPDDVLFHYMVCICRAVNELVENGIIHRDIKPENMIVQKGDVRLIDFGFSCRKSKCPHVLCGTPRYLPPEQYEKKFFGAMEKQDIYAAGVCMLSLFLDLPPGLLVVRLKKGKYGETLDQIRPLLLERAGEKVTTFILLLLSEDYNRRPSAKQALELAEKLSE